MVEFDDEGMFNQRTDVLLVFYDVLFLILKYKLFAHDLHGVVFAIIFTPYQVDFAESTDGQTLHNPIPVQSISIFVVKAP